MNISSPKVMHSNAGYYIGRSYFDDDCQCDFPYDRLSGYYKDTETANRALKSYLLG